MDGGAFQGMPRIALTPAEEAMLPRPHSSASQVASAIPSTYTRMGSSPVRHPYYHPSASNSFVGGGGSANGHSGLAGTPSSATGGPISTSAAILAAAAASVSSIGLPRPVSPSPLRPSSPGHDRNALEPEYPQNPQDDYYRNLNQQQQVSPPRSSSPAPRIPFSVSPRPARSPSPQLYNNLFQNTSQGYHRPSYSRGSYDTHRRPGSPLQQERQESWNGTNIHAQSPGPGSDSEEAVHETEDDDRASSKGGGGTESDRPPIGVRKKSLLRRLQEHTPRLSFGDDSSSRADRTPPQRSSQESDQIHRRSSVDSTMRPDLSTLTASQETSHRDSGDERPEPRKSRSGWRPSLSIIRQESTTSSPHPKVYAQNERPHLDTERWRKRRGGKRRKRKGKKTVKLNDAPHYFPGYSYGDEEQGGVFAFLKRSSRVEEEFVLPSLQHVLDKKTRYPLSYEDFEAFLRSHRAVEYIHFWADVAAHEQLCRTFDASERRQKRELQLEERALARDRRRLALAAALEAGRSTPEPDGPGQLAQHAGDPMAANDYVTSRSSLQLPLNDHLSFPMEARRYGITDMSAPYGPIPPTYNQGRQSGTYNRLLAGESVGRRQRPSNELNRPSLEEAHIQEQDAAVAAVALKSGRILHGPYDPPRRQDSWSQSRDDLRRGSHDVPRSGSPGAGIMSQSSPYSTLYNGRGSIDLLRRSSSRASRTRHLAEDYYGHGMRRTSSQQFHYQQQLQHQHQRHLQQLQQQQLQQHQHLHETPLKQEVNDGAENSAQSGAATSNNPENISPNLEPIPTSASPEPMSEPSGMLHKSPSLTFANRSMLRGVASYSRLNNGVGPLQPPISIRRSGESAYSPSLISQDVKPLMALSFRTITLEDIQESALRLYRKYLVQLRTASMAAEEAAAEEAAANEKGRKATLVPNRSSVEKPALVPGWEGYAEEVIAQWNESWRGRARSMKRRRSSRKSIVTRSALAGDEETPPDTEDNNEDASKTEPRSLRINTEVANSHETIDSEDEFYDVDEDVDDSSSSKKAKTPKLPLTPRTRRRTGTGLSSVLSPYLPKFLKTETVVMELPTLTVNTTTVEEDDDYYSFDEDDDDEDGSEYESDDEEEDDEGSASDKDEQKISEKPTAQAPPRQSPPNKIGIEEMIEKVEAVDRSVSFVPPLTPQLSSATANQDHQRTTMLEPLENETSTALNTVASPESPIPGPSSSSRPIRPPRSRGASVSSHNSWVRLSHHDLDNTDIPMPITSSTRSSARLIRGIRGTGGVQSRTGKVAGKAAGKAAMAASHAARKVGLQLSNIIRNKSDSSSSLDTIQVTPANSPRLQPYLHEAGDAITLPPIIVTKQTPDDTAEYISPDVRVHPLDLNAMAPSPSTSSQDASNAGTQGLLTPRQQDATGLNTTPFVSQHSSMTNSAVSSLSEGVSPHLPISAVQSGIGAPRSSQASSQVAAMASSAASAAFYLPLEIRQRIHHQVLKDHRTENPHLFGPAKGFVVDIVLQDYYFPLFLQYAQSQNLGLLTRSHPKNRLKERGMLWIGIAGWIVVFGIQLTLVLIGHGGWNSPWVWLTGILGGWTSTVFVATGLTGFSPLLGLVGKIVDDKRLFQFRRIFEPSIRHHHRQRALSMLAYCIFFSSIIMIVFAALPQRQP